MEEELQHLLTNTSLFEISATLWKKGDYDFIVKGTAINTSDAWVIGQDAVHEKQRQAFELLTSNKYKEILYGGAAGGAKTWTGCCWILFQAHCFAGTRWFIARDELKDIVESVYVTWQKVCREYGYEQGKDWKFNAVKNFIKLSNGSEINFVELKYKPSDPMYEGLGSTEYTGGWIEEVGDVHETGAITIAGRAGRHMNAKYGLKGTVLYTGNPKKNWSKREFYDKNKSGTIGDDRFFLSCLVTENPFIEQDYIDYLRGLAKKDKKLFERYFKGNWEYEDNERALCDYEMIEQIPHNDHVQQGRTFLVADVARYGSDKARIGIFRGWRLVKAVSMDISKTTDIEMMVRHLRRQFQIPKNYCIADEDGVGCISEKTEVLTDKGWVYAKDLTMDSVIVSKDENGYIEYCNPKDLSFLDSERFIETEQGYKFTETHAHFYKTRKEHSIKKGYWDDIVEYGKVYNDTYVQTRDDNLDKVYFESTKWRNNALSIDRDVFMYFLGWMASDGSLDGWNDKHVIRISQAKNSPNNDKIIDMLDKVGVNYIVKRPKDNLLQYEFQHKALFDWIKKECYSDDVLNFITKKVSNFVKRQSKNHILKFVEGYLDGDGYYHKGAMQFTGTNKQLLDGVQEVLFYCGINTTFYISHKKGSVGYIEGRKITRTRDCYLLSQRFNSKIITPGETKKYFDRAVNIYLPNKTKAYVVRMANNVFWTHNGGVVDGTGIRGFVNNSKPIKEKGVSKQGFETPQYANLQTQCLYKLADIINEGKLWIMPNVVTNVEWDDIKEELDQIQSWENNDRKLMCKPKKEIKQDIGRSPDWRDLFLMRVYFELKPPRQKGLTTKPRNSM